MKKLTLTLTFCLIVVIAKSQTPTLSTLIRYVNTPVADLTEEVISINGWELTESEVVDSVVTLHFNFKDASLLIRKVKDYKNEISLICNKLKYDNLNKELLQLAPKLVDSRVNEKGHVVKTYWGEKYGYKISIAPKSVFVVQVFDKENSLIREQLESLPAKTGSIEAAYIQDSNFGETPMPLRKFKNLVMPQDDGLKTGKIAVRIKVYNDGNVIDATPGVKGTTLNDRDLWQKCKASIMGAKMPPSNSLPSLQIGIVVFNFKVK
ncbi:hypothetical protein HQN84_30180 [Pedobacter steynii]|nr:hypothetical protein [Pedobacter steynii]NQX43156.1 hypothetical protein [Pedobacter steynii]